MFFIPNIVLMFYIKNNCMMFYLENNFLLFYVWNIESDAILEANGGQSGIEPPTSQFTPPKGAPL